jgi:corrinoid protein of di/trimethylamine methyltransferase
MQKEQQALLEEAQKAIINYDVSKAEEAAKKALASGIEPYTVINEGLVPGITEVGDLFDRGQLFLPELILAADAMKAGSAVCMAAVPAAEVKTAKKVVIGTIEGDIHDIGKSIVVSFLLANGFEVYDIGRDVPLEKFIEKATEVNADVIGMSALLTTTMEGQKAVIAKLKEVGLRDKFKVIVGGAPTSQAWANRIGADAYGGNAVDAVKKIKEVTGLS